MQTFIINTFEEQFLDLLRNFISSNNILQKAKINSSLQEIELTF